MALMLSMCGGDEEEQAICSFGMLVDCANTAMVEWPASLSSVGQNYGMGIKKGKQMKN